MIPASFYYPIYLFIVSIITFFYLSPYYSASNNNVLIRSREGKTGPAALLTFILTLFIAIRPISGDFRDMAGYAMAMVDGRFEGLPITWDCNYIFQPMMGFLSSIHASQRTPIVILAIINFGCTYWAMKRLFPKDVLLAMLVFFGAFSTFGAATNGLKAGCAAALFLVAISYRKKVIISLLLLFLSMGFHHSMQLPIIAYIICTFYKNPKAYIIFWLICIFLAASHITSYMTILANYTDAQGADYLLIQSDSLETGFEGKTGFRIDFVIYSAIPVAIGYWALLRKKLESAEYQFMYNLYLLVNGVWLLCMYAQFTNRIAYLSWLMYPVLIIYPFINMDWGKKKNRILYYVVMGHLAFTLFMQIIYYA